MALEVHLIGEYHTDLLRNERHYSAIQKIKPDAVSLEISQEDMKRFLQGANEYMASRYGSPENAMFLLGKDRSARLYGQLSGYGMILADANKLSIPVRFTDNQSLRQEVIESIVSHLKDVYDINEQDTAQKDTELWEEVLSSPEPQEIILLRALGRSRVQRYIAENIPPEAIFVAQMGLLDVILNSTTDEILSANKSLDGAYFLMPRNAKEYTKLRLNQRDEETAKQILSLDGRIMHCCGLLHAFGGEHQDLYALLQKRGCKVFRHKLIDFDPRPDIEQYKSSAHQLAINCVQLSSDIKQAYEAGLPPPDLFGVL